jgi:tetratricopeptide (TPR) repeat protein
VSIAPNNNFDQLRTIPINDLLDQIEIDLSHLGQYKPEQAYWMLLRLDAAYQKISEMRAAQNPVTAESAQFDYLEKSISKNCRALIHDLGGKEAVARLREGKNPDTEFTWWNADHIDEMQTRKRMRNFAIRFTIFAGVIAVIFMLYNLFLKPDPVVAARYNYEMDAERALSKNDFPAALEAVNKAIALGGDTSSQTILRGAVETMMGQVENATADFKTAELEIGNRSIFLTARAETWIKVGKYDSALQDAAEAVVLDPSSAQALFEYGRASELTGKYSQALDAYQRASDLAEQQGRAELNATIRITLAMLMQTSPGQIPNILETSTTR